MSHLASLPEIQATKSDFWRRQIFGPRTVGRTVFDVAFGLLAPIFCFVADPGVMFAGRFSLGLQRTAPLFVLAVAALSMLALVVLLLFGRRPGALDSVLAGVLLAGAAVAFLVGLALLPITAIGLLFVIGVFGFLPFFTSLVCFRNGAGLLATRGGRKQREDAALAAVAVLLLGAGYQVGADIALDAMVADIARTGSPASIERLESWRPLLPRREMTRRGLDFFSDRGGDPRGEQYEVAIQRVTGEDLLGSAD
jgi:hypothetical protein